MQLLTRILLFVILLAILTLFYPLAIAYNSHKPSAILTLFFFLIFFLIPLTYLYRYGYFHKK